MWVVDTCIVLDVLEHDPSFGLRPASQVEQLLNHRLCLAHATTVVFLTTPSVRVPMSVWA